MKRKKKKENRFSLLYILGGGILKEDFILRHNKLLLLIVLLILIFIGNRYSCTLKIRQIDRLQKELTDVRLEALSLSVDLAKYSQRSLIEERAKQLGLGLEGAKTQPNVLYK
ncbi:hypothetical protein FACS189435_4420 [Bacteroidia bacterium]|nr:hypothetical protein FACS189435_4420 [Bacteroidia bacterium]